jgi:hypothetical protein
MPFKRKEERLVVSLSGGWMEKYCCEDDIFKMVL